MRVPPLAIAASVSLSAFDLPSSASSEDSSSDESFFLDAFDDFDEPFFEDPFDDFDELRLEDLDEPFDESFASFEVSSPESSPASPASSLRSSLARSSLAASSFEEVSSSLDELLRERERLRPLPPRDPRRRDRPEDDEVSSPPSWVSLFGASSAVVPVSVLSVVSVCSLIAGSLGSGDLGDAVLGERHDVL